MSGSTAGANDTLARLRHDIGTFLNHIVGYSDLLRSDVSEDENLAKLFDEIRSTALDMRVPLMRYFGASDTESTRTSESDEEDRTEIFGFLYDIVSQSQTAKRLVADRGPENLQADVKRIADAANGIMDIVEARPPFMPDTGVVGDAMSPEGSEAAALAESDAEVECTESTYRGRVLLVDDDPINRDLLRRRLERMGHVVCVTDNGSDAFEILKKAPFDVAIMDVMMPRINGFKLLSMIKADERLRGVFVIVISALADTSGIAKCIRLGAEDYLPREFDPVILHARIESCLEKKRLREREERSLRAMAETQRKLASELREAAEYVRSLLPRKARWKHLETDWIFIPSLSLGGDIFGYHELPDGRLVMYLIDVSGHGIEAALVSVTIMNILKAQSLPDADFGDPSSVLGGLNASFRSEEQNNLFFTAWYGTYDPTTRLLRYASAGSPPAVLVGPDGVAQELVTDGMVIGISPEARFNSRQVEILAGSRLFVFSDGVYEVRTKEGPVLSWEDFVSLVVEASRTPSPYRVSPLEALISAIKQFCDKPRFEDDVSVVACRFDA